MADSLDGLAVGVLQGWVEVAWFYVFDQPFVVIEGWTWGDGDVASVGLHD